MRTPSFAQKEGHFITFTQQPHKCTNVLNFSFTRSNKNLTLQNHLILLPDPLIVKERQVKKTLGKRFSCSTKQNRIQRFHLSYLKISQDQHTLRPNSSHTIFCPKSPTCSSNKTQHHSSASPNLGRNHFKPPPKRWTVAPRCYYCIARP